MQNGRCLIAASRNSASLKAMTFRERAELALTTYRRVNDETGCWVWAGCALTTGHGQVRIAGKCHLVHRLSAWLYLGLDIDNRFMGSRRDRSQVNHKCDNARCFNPAHLYVGTQAENLQDRPRERVLRSMPSHCRRGHAISAANYRKGVGCLDCRRTRMAARYQRED